MAWNLDCDRPIYLQLVERIQKQIVSGQYRPGSRLPSVRELAAIASVNPNTMQKAFTELERGGLIITQRTNGRIVTEDQNMIDNVRREMACKHTDEFFRRMEEIGYTRQESIERILKFSEREERGE